MDFAFGPDEEQFRAEVREFFRCEVSSDEIDAMFWTEEAEPRWRLLKLMGRKGWLSLNWPVEYGGQGKPGTYRLILLEEMAYRGAPVGGFNTGGRIVAPTLMLYGSDEQKQQYLPEIAVGNIDFALGYTEPAAGSDLAALEMSAVDEGDYFRISGQKMFSSACHHSTHHWLAVRTDPVAPKHRGISLFMVDLSSPGITVKPLWAIEGTRTNVVYYDDVRVPRANLVGEKNRGFYYIATALSFERMFVVGEEIRILEELIRYAKRTPRGGRLLFEHEWVRGGLAEMVVAVRVGRLMSYKLAWMQSVGTIPTYEASQLKLYISEMRRKLADFAMRLLGHLGELQHGEPRSPSDQGIARFYDGALFWTIVGGTSEVQRNIIAQRGLGLPRKKARYLFGLERRAFVARFGGGSGIL
ncbi:MAG: acyl-CoA dehydrogenase [Chloroflexota bacterium]|nr:MAG: acyl-CoA dehydrogenase [Chloroflexota bacterium]